MIDDFLLLTIVLYIMLQSHALLDLIVIGRVLQKIAFFDLGDISNIRLFARLQYFMENDPVRFSILSPS